MMRNKFNALLVSLIVFLTGCATASGPPFVMPELPEDMVTIFAFRTASIVGGGNSDIVAVNGRFIGRINSGTYAVHQVEPGPIVVSRKGGSIFGSGENAGWGLSGVVGYLDGFITVAEIDGKAGEVYFIRFSHGDMVDRKEAIPLMDKLERVTPQTDQ